MKHIIAAILNDQETSTVTNYKAAAVRNEASAASVLVSLQQKACKFEYCTWEAMLDIAADAANKAISAAKMAANLSQHTLGKDVTAADNIILPLAAFADSFKTVPSAWMANNTAGEPISGDVAAGLLKALRLLQSNTRMRMNLLQNFNDSVETSVESEGMKVVLDTKVSAYTNQPLKPLSKRDLTAQIDRAVTFLANNPGGFTIH